MVGLILLNHPRIYHLQGPNTLDKNYGLLNQTVIYTYIFRVCISYIYTPWDVHIMFLESIHIYIWQSLKIRHPNTLWNCLIVLEKIRICKDSCVVFFLWRSSSLIKIQLAVCIGSELAFSNILKTLYKVTPVNQLGNKKMDDLKMHPWFERWAVLFTQYFHTDLAGLTKAEMIWGWRALKQT